MLSSLRGSRASCCLAIGDSETVYGERETHLPGRGGARDATRHARPAATAACSAPVGHSRGAWADAGRAPRGPARDAVSPRRAQRRDWALLLGGSGVGYGIRYSIV